MEVKKGNNQFYIGESESSALARMEYIEKDDKFIITETKVSDELGGKGAGKILLKELVDWARTQGKKITPECPFAKSQMEKNEEYHDMIN